MDGMSVQERIEDICKISGLSEEIVRRVLNAEKQSIIKSLRRGERATLIGRCTIRPEIRTKLGVYGQEKRYIKLIAKPAPALEAELADLEDFEEPIDNGDIAEEVRLNQIPSLL